MEFTTVVVVPLIEVIPLHRIVLLLAWSNRGRRSIAVLMLFTVISETLYSYSCNNKKLICSMLSNVVFQKTSHRSLGWNTGRSGFSESGATSMTSHKLNPAELHGRVPSARWRDDGDNIATDAGLLLSTAMI